MSTPALSNVEPRSLAAASLVVILGLHFAGCSRRHYRLDADGEVAHILAEKDAAEPYQLPYQTNVYPDARARFFDPTNPDCPKLPGAVPTLNSYPLPPLVSGDPSQASRTDRADDSPDGLGEDGASDLGDGVPVEEVLPAPAVDAVDDAVDDAASTERATDPAIQLATLVQPSQPPVEEITPPAGEEIPVGGAEAVQGGTSDDSGLRIVPIPAATWENIPEVCLPRMLEFESMREEYRRTFGRGVPEGLTSDAPRLTLPNVMELALINSREYQTRKEVLYQTALRLTRERYQYMLKPTATGNGTALNYRSLNVQGEQVNTLNIPTRAAVTQTMATAGQFLASFANDVALTFNGPQGFAADVNSTLLFQFEQTIFQRDVVFEALTQAERDVVYASRDFIRFRRQLFRDLANQYYDLLLSYRAIEIASQDYFSNLRGFLQAQAEYVAGQLPRVQVDQFEQNALRSRSDLVSRCNQLESSLDRLKLSMGLQPEMPLNLDLGELETLTASDEWTVARELVSRTRRELLAQQERTRRGASGLINAATVLADRIADIQRLSRQLREDATSGEATLGEAAEGLPESEELTRVTNVLHLLEAQGRVDALRGELRGDRELDLLPLQVYFRNLDLIDALLGVTEQSLRIRKTEADAALEAEAIQDVRERRASIAERRSELEEMFRVLPPEEKLAQLPDVVARSEMLVQEAEQLADETSEGLVPDDREAFLEFVEATVADSLQLADQAIAGSDAGLAELEVEEDPAMLSALVNRLDLMNRRGELSDARRTVKIAADDLRSILDLRATQILRTDPDSNSPFDFGFDNSETQLSIALDTPLNRRVQRNNYRVALINYNQAIRQLIESEDGIKFEIREDLRNLRLRRNQYEIAIKSAALAYERVVSTRLQLQLPGGGDVVARDFLEAQQAYTAALSSVASQHIAFILDRVELFFDLEAIRLDPVGYWPGLRDEEMQPMIDLNFPANNPHPYGTLPPRLHYSEEIQRTVR
ncbi:TolC family protein [Candidatus Laterigemmans baculatus]|uniref:TolC family protein n=1 Tax=Candidatus Laterigemmans baculatus TaxID=2770505 RepID=UPI0013DD3C20|nr:TolC family protein [Candidatus Laterigemmans baculatus]